MKNLFVIIYLIICVGCSPEIDQSSIRRIDGTVITKTDLDSKVESMVRLAKVTGLAITIINDGSLAYYKAFGVSDSRTKDSLRLNHIFSGASFSKAIFGYLMAQLAEKDSFDLDKPLHKLLDISLTSNSFDSTWRNFETLSNDSRHEDITARMCLSHTTGFPNWRWITREGEFDPEGQIKIYFDPGSEYSYSGEGIRLLQKVLETYTGQNLQQMAEDMVFQPLDMHMSSYVWQDRFTGSYCLGHAANEEVIGIDLEYDAGAAGSLVTTPSDYSKFLVKLIELHRSNSEITKLMFSSNIEINSSTQFGPGSLESTTAYRNIELSYGLGWGILQSPYGHGYFKEGHSEGFQHYSIIYPDQNIGVLIMSNSDNAESIFKELLEITIADVYTPWQWENYIPYDQTKGSF